ncbi:MAG: hypothetical protein M3680_04465 [Myxococcota bacterium]|nr:hypothetical protein [Myxococcota bacterium]
MKPDSVPAPTSCALRVVRRLGLVVGLLGGLGGVGMAGNGAGAVAQPTGKQRIVGILEVRGPTPHDEAAFEKNLEQQLDTNQYWLAPRAKMRERLRNSTKWTEGCLVDRCLTEVKVQTNAELVILAALTGSGTSFGFVVTVVRTDTGRVVSQESERCDVCTLTETMNAATLATIKLLDAVPDRLPDERAQKGATVDLAVGLAMAPVQQQLVRVERTNTRVGRGLTVVGLVAAVAGSALYFLQDERPAYGLVLGAAGGGLATSGVIVLAF